MRKSTKKWLCDIPRVSLLAGSFIISGLKVSETKQAKEVAFQEIIDETKEKALSANEYLSIYPAEYDANLLLLKQELPNLNQIFLDYGPAADRYYRFRTDGQFRSKLLTDTSFQQSLAKATECTQGYGAIHPGDARPVGFVCTEKPIVKELKGQIETDPIMIDLEKIRLEHQSFYQYQEQLQPTGYQSRLLMENTRLRTALASSDDEHVQKIGGLIKKFEQNDYQNGNYILAFACLVFFMTMKLARLGAKKARIYRDDHIDNWSVNKNNIFNAINSDRLIGMLLIDLLETIYKKAAGSLQKPQLDQLKTEIKELLNQTNLFLFNKTSQNPDEIQKTLKTLIHKLEEKFNSSPNNYEAPYRLNPNAHPDLQNKLNQIRLRISDETTKDEDQISDYLEELLDIQEQYEKKQATLPHS